MGMKKEDAPHRFYLLRLLKTKKRKAITYEKEKQRNGRRMGVGGDG